jgi:hypothetical protein
MTTATKTILTGVNFEGCVVAGVPDHYDPDGNPFYTLVEMRPEKGMRVRAYYDSTGDVTRVYCFPLETPSPNQERTRDMQGARIRSTSDLIGDGVITQLRYRPGTSGKLYPEVTVEIA